MRTRVFALTTGYLLVGCGGGGGGGGVTTPPPPPAPNPVSTVTVAVASSSLIAGATTQATATLRDASGGVLTNRAVTWASSNTAVATVSTAGLITAVAQGSATISATSEGRTGSAAVSVAPIPVATVQLSTAQSTLSPGGVTQVTATLRGSSGQVLSGRTVAWQSSNPAVATVSSTGLVTAVAVGTTTITGTSEGQAGTLQVTVAAPTVASVVVSPGSLALVAGQAQALAATVRDANQSILTDRTVTWLSSNAAVATVSQAGVVTAVAAGSATITATADGISGTASVAVSTVPVASITLNSGALTLPAGDAFVLIATPRDANSNPLPGRSVQWTSSNLSVVDGYVFADTAIISGLQPGSATITATSEGKSASIVVTVLPPQTANVCSVIAGASVIANDGQYLGRLTNQFDSQSVYNQFGVYGSQFSATSTNNRFGQYGSPYSSLSAWNPYTSTPPILVKNNTAIAYFTVNTFLSPRVSPAYAATCNFP